MGNAGSKDKGQPTPKPKPKPKPKSVDSRCTLPQTVFDTYTIELKLSFRKSHRRIMVDEKISYNRLVKEVKKRFDMNGTVILYYEDDEDELVKIGSSVEVKAMLVMAKRRNTCTRLFVRKR